MNVIESQVFSGELWIKASDHHRAVAAARADERNKLAAWMIQFGFATGHGDTMEELVDALGSEIVDRIEFEIDTEREVCAQMADDVVAGKRWFNDLPADIRARGNNAA